MRKTVIAEDYSKHVTVVASLFYEGKMLILKRGSNAPWKPNYWSLVGGGVDDGENFERAIRREVMEETGQKIQDLKYIKKLSTPDIGQIVYFTGTINNKITLDWENQEFKFISKEEMPKYKFVPYIKEFMNHSFLLEHIKILQSKVIGRPPTASNKMAREQLSLSIKELEKLRGNL